MKLAERIAFYGLCLLIFTPWIGLTAFWMLNLGDLGLGNILAGAHIVGVLGIVIWSVLFLKPYPRHARTG
jgi:hypothetical protein